MTVRKFYLGCFELHDYFEIKQNIKTCLLFEPGILNIIKTLTHYYYYYYYYYYADLNPIVEVFPPNVRPDLVIVQNRQIFVL